MCFVQQSCTQVPLSFVRQATVRRMNENERENSVGATAINASGTQLPNRAKEREHVVGLVAWQLTRGDATLQQHCRPSPRSAPFASQLAAMDSATTKKTSEQDKQAEIRRQIALLQAQLDTGSSSVHTPPSSPKRKRSNSHLLAPATPSPSEWEKRIDTQKY